MAIIRQDSLIEDFKKIAKKDKWLWRFLISIYMKDPLILTVDLMVIFLRVTVSCTRFR